MKVACPISLFSVADFSERMSAKVGTKTPRVALQEIEEAYANTPAQGIVAALQTRMDAGDTLSAALDQFPEVFSEHYRRDVRKSEQEGLSDCTFDRLSFLSAQRAEYQGERVWTWNSEVLGAWLLACRYSDFDGRGVDLKVARDAADGKVSLQGMTPDQIGTTVARVEAAVNAMEAMEVRQNPEIDKAATDLVHGHQPYVLFATYLAVQQTASPEMVALYRLASEGIVDPQLSHNPMVQGLVSDKLATPTPTSAPSFSM